ncbi:1674_t:CDS:2, partial [Funneliformis geosporum]
MTPTPMTIVKEMCGNFIISFIDHNIQNTIPDKLIHDGSWKESEEKIADVIKESITSADRKGEGQVGRQPDIIYVVKYLDVFFELIYIECSRIYCSQQKKIDDEIKLWRESNDGMFWVRKVHKPEKGQFGIVGVQVAGNMLHLNVLIRDKANVHRYFYLQSAEFPVQLSDV